MFEFDPNSGSLWLKVGINPVPQARPRIFQFNGKSRAKTPPKSKRFKYELRGALQAHTIKERVAPLEGPLALFAHFILAKPPSLTAKEARERPYPSVKPDLDNYAKAVLDAFNGIAWKDDGQVTSMNIQKHYAKPGELPGIEIIIEPARWHMARLERRETILGTMVAPGGDSHKRQAVGLEINFSDKEPQG